MAKDQEILEKLNAIYGLLSSPAQLGRQRAGGNPELEIAVRKAIGDLEKTKSSFRSKQIMRIKEELSKALNNKG